MLALEKVSFMRETFFCPCVVQGGYTAVISRASSDSLLQNYICLLVVIENEQMIEDHPISLKVFLKISSTVKR